MGAREREKTGIEVTGEGLRAQSSPRMVAVTGKSSEFLFM